MPATLSESAKRFQELHQSSNVLILPNAWDAMSARLIEGAGAKAIATSSAAVAWAHGYSDGHHLPIALLADTVAAIARVVSIPVSADAEGGYADDPATVAENVRTLIGAGAVGINLEDGHDAPELHQRKIAAVREAATRAGVALYINARTDVFLKKLAPPERAVEETVRRGLAARDAGASGLFVPGLGHAAEIAAIVKGVGIPVNVAVRPGLPNAAELAVIGVRRLSAATATARVAWTALRTATETFVQTGDSEALWQAAGPPQDYNALFPRRG